MRRKDSSYPEHLHPLGILYVIVCASFVIAAFIMTYIQGHKSPQRSINVVSPLGIVRISDEERIDVYVFIDPDTNKQYLVTQSGGICERDMDSNYYD